MTIRKYFDMGHDWLVVPKAVENIPIAMAKMMKDDGSYLSVNGLVEQLASEGYVLNIVPVIDDRFILVHYGFTYEEDADERAMLKEFLIGMGLVNMRAGKKLNEIDWSSMNGNEFGISAKLRLWKYRALGEKHNDSRRHDDSGRKRNPMCSCVYDI